MDFGIKEPSVTSTSTQLCQHYSSQQHIMGYYTIVQLLCCLAILQQGNTLPVSSSTYGHLVSNLSSDHLLTVHGGYGDPGTVIDIYERSQDPFWINTHQLWRKEVQSEGTFKVVSRLGNHVHLTMEVSIYMNCICNAHIDFSLPLTH